MGDRLDIQTKLMGYEKGVMWAKGYQKIPFPPVRGSVMVGSLDWHDACPFVNQLDKVLNSKENQITVVQLGASSGREIAYFAKKYPRHHFIYTDVFDSVVDYASSIFNLPNLDFITFSAESIHVIASVAMNDQIVILSSGSAQFVHPELLDSMFYRLSHYVKRKRIHVIVHEPGNVLDGDPLSIEGSKPRDNFSYTHNYHFYAIRSGFSSSH